MLDDMCIDLDAKTDAENVDNLEQAVNWKLRRNL